MCSVNINAFLILVSRPDVCLASRLDLALYVQHIFLFKYYILAKTNPMIIIKNYITNYCKLCKKNYHAIDNYACSLGSI